MMLRYKDANECLMEGVSLEAMRDALEQARAVVTGRIPVLFYVS
jgi:hypothetical protein